MSDFPRKNLRGSHVEFLVPHAVAGKVVAKVVVETPGGKFQELRITMCEDALRGVVDGAAEAFRRIHSARALQRKWAVEAFSDGLRKAEEKKES